MVYFFSLHYFGVVLLDFTIRIGELLKQMDDNVEKLYAICAKKYGYLWSISMRHMTKIMEYE